MPGALFKTQTIFKNTRRRCLLGWHLGHLRYRKSLDFNGRGRGVGARGARCRRCRRRWRQRRLERAVVRARRVVDLVEQQREHRANHAAQRRIICYTFLVFFCWLYFYYNRNFSK